jgi:SH3-like domain-containing protein
MSAFRTGAISIALCWWVAIPLHAGASAKRDAERTVPRFASLKRSEINVRVGPGTQYPIRWIYRRKGLPVGIIAEFDNWRRIRGSDGSDGWVHSALLSARRMALVDPWSRTSVDVKARPGERSAVVARLQPQVVVQVWRCDRGWCTVAVPEHDLQGYVRQVKLWGVYPDETIGGSRATASAHRFELSRHIGVSKLDETRLEREKDV